MENIIFKSKRQIKDFNKIYDNMFIEEKNIKNNELGNIIITLTNYSQNALAEVEKFINSLNNKNIIFNKKQCKIDIL